MFEGEGVTGAGVITATHNKTGISGFVARGYVSSSIGL